MVKVTFAKYFHTFLRKKSDFAKESTFQRILFLNAIRNGLNHIQLTSSDYICAKLSVNVTKVINR